MTESQRKKIDELAEKCLTSESFVKITDGEIDIDLTSVFKRGAKEMHEMISEEVERLEKEVSELNQDSSFWRLKFGECSLDNDRIKEENARLRQALKFCSLDNVSQREAKFHAVEVLKEIERIEWGEMKRENKPRDFWLNSCDLFEQINNLNEYAEVSLTDASLSRFQLNLSDGYQQIHFKEVTSPTPEEVFERVVELLKKTHRTTEGTTIVSDPFMMVADWLDSKRVDILK